MTTTTINKLIGLGMPPELAGIAGLESDAVANSDLTATATVAQFPLGQEVLVGATKFKYVKATGGAKVAGAVYAMNKDYDLTSAYTTTIGASVVKLGVPQIAIAENSFAWVAVQGVMNVSVLASAAAGAALYSTATAGSLDDASSSVKLVPGLTLTTSNGGATANAPAFAAIELYSMP
jgi:hypothetical protein